MKRLEYQEETVERFTDYLETLVTKRDAAEKLAELAREHGMEPPNVDWCGQTWDALKTSGVLPKARDASGALYVPPWLHRADGSAACSRGRPFQRRVPRWAQYGRWAGLGPSRRPPCACTARRASSSVWGVC